MKWKRFLPWVTGLFLGTTIFWGCTNPTGLGLDLLDEDLLTLVYTDTLSIESGTELVDSVRTHSPFTFLQSYLLGRLDDPIFGTSSAELYAQLIPEFLRPDFNMAELDSVILVLPYDTGKFYGDLQRELTLDVFRLEERISPNNPYFSNASFAVNPVSLGRFTGKLSRDSVSVLDYPGTGQTTIAFPHLRIPLASSFGRELLRLDTILYSTDSLFLDYFKGLYIRPAAGGGSLAGVTLASNRAGIILYYRLGDARRQYRFVFNPFLANVSVFRHIYEGAPISGYLGNASTATPYMFVQGMSGVNGVLRFPHVRNFKNVIVNKAELEIRVAPFQGDNLPLFPPPLNLALYYRDAANNLTLIPDVLQSRESLLPIFGGQFQAGAGGEPGLYRMSLTSHFQDMVEGKVPTELVIGLAPKAESAARVILYGSAHPEYKVRLKIAYTKLD